MKAQTFRISMHPLQDGVHGVTLGEFEYELLDIIEGLEKAKFIKFHPPIDDDNIVVSYTFPSIFYIDRANSQILNEDKKVIARITMMKKR